ncbi:alpha/beta fold hydrolase [Isoptericola sp. NPDC055881]
MPYVPTAVSTSFRVLAAVAPPLAVRLAARTFWRFGPPTPVRAADRAVHERAERGMVRVDGERVVTYRWGDRAAPAVLLAHGWKSRASRFAALVTALEDAGLGVVSFDGLAHGDSTGRRMSALDHMAAMRAVLDAEGPFTGVVGHSLGGLAAGLALHDGFPTDRFVSVSAMTGFDALAATFLRLVGMPASQLDRFCDHVARTFPGQAPDVRARIDLVTHPVPASVPTLVVHDADDRMSLPDGARRLHAAMPGSRLVVTSGLGHTRILDDPAVLDAVVAHITANVTAPVGATSRR